MPRAWHLSDHWGFNLSVSLASVERMSFSTANIDQLIEGMVLEAFFYCRWREAPLSVDGRFETPFVCQWEFGISNVRISTNRTKEWCWRCSFTAVDVKPCQRNPGRFEPHIVCKWQIWNILCSDLLSKWPKKPRLGCPSLKKSDFHPAIVLPQLFLNL